jgi:hypothetical protein
MGYELVDGIYVEVSPDENGGFRSSSLGLDFHLRDEGLGIYDPVANEWVRTRAEAAEARAAQEVTRAETAEARAAQEVTRAEAAEARAAQEVTRADTAEARTAQEAAARQEAEAEAEKLREQIARLQART